MGEVGNKYLVNAMSQTTCHIFIKFCIKITSPHAWDSLSVSLMQDLAESTSNQTWFLYAIVKHKMRCGYSFSHGWFDWESCCNGCAFYCCRSPDCASVKQKMLYSSSKDALKKTLGTGIGISMQACDYDEVSEESLSKEIQRLDKA